MFLSLSWLCLGAGGNGLGEESRWSFAGGSQAAVLQRQLPQPAPVHPRHSSHSLEKQTTGKVSGETLKMQQILDNSLLKCVVFMDVAYKAQIISRKIIKTIDTLSWLIPFFIFKLITPEKKLWSASCHLSRIGIFSENTASGLTIHCCCKHPNPLLHSLGGSTEIAVGTFSE